MNMQDDVIREMMVSSIHVGAKLRLQLIGSCMDAILQASHILQTCFRYGGKVMLFGNGGSASDAQHIAAEFVGRFGRDRIPLPAIALTTETSALTAIGNDYGFEYIFARQIEALGKQGDVAIGISTSGRSPNILAGARVARERSLTVIALTGGDGGPLALIADIPIIVPSDSTARIQECHISIGHILCEAVEAMLPSATMNRDVLMQADSIKAATIVSKVTDWDVLLNLREQWRTQQKTVVWTSGCFDLLHLGHIRSLQAARTLGDLLVVGVNSDNSVRKLKGRGRPVIPASQRVETLAALECIDHVVVFDERSPEAALSRLKPDIYCKGADYAPPNGKPMPEAAVVQSYGGRVVFLPLYPFISTSQIVQRIRQQEGNNDIGEK